MCRSSVQRSPGCRNWQAYLAVDLEWQHGSAGFAAAVLERLGSPPEHPAVEGTSRDALGRMLAVADRLAVGPHEDDSP